MTLSRLRHSRSQQFEEALRSIATGQAMGGRWTDVSSDPNAAVALARRAQVLRAAWRPPIPDRLEFLVRRCRGRRLLDVGCVAHDAGRMDAPNWLHGRLAAVAGRCVGVDVLAGGVEAMRDRGYQVVLHDLVDGLGPLRPELPFDVIVAGELIEHVGSVDMLFRVAAEALAPQGEMILTTPNPYAPHRVRAGQLGIVWENVDHVLYACPSGVAELAERHGLVLAEAAVTGEPETRGALPRLRHLRRRLAGRHWVTVGFATIGCQSVRRVGYRRLGRLVHGMSSPRRWFLGETFVYVIRRPDPSTR